MPPIFGWLATHINFNIFPIFIGIILIIKIIMVETLNRKIDNQNKKQMGYGWYRT
jgi:4-hydroxybenzoate polyprenyltransferase